ncbi:MAG TPA: hypothetical protein PK906_16450 [Spirochaetota bacterium]|nr:hypothetical protein [Spirochaetota bacterium]
MKRISLIILVAVAVALSCSASIVKKEPDYCKTKYPVILVHGIAFRDKTVMIKYWGNVPDKLHEYGAVVHTGGQEAYGTIRENSILLKKKIKEILQITGSEKVNIIAHSRGGIEARYMISRLDMNNSVASLTTVATPHRGSAMADIIMKEIDEKSLLPDIIDFFAKAIGDYSPSAYNAGIELTRDYMKRFNNEVPDAESVYYQSYAASINSRFINPVWRKMYETVEKYEGANDGLVSVKSAKWGEFRGIVLCDGEESVSHSDIIGMHFLSGEFCFNEEKFYVEMVHELKLKGY